MDAIQSDSAYAVLLRIASGDPEAIAWCVDHQLKIVANSGNRHVDFGAFPEIVPVEKFFDVHNASAEIVVAHRRALQGESRFVNFFWLGQPYRAHVAPDYGPQYEIKGVLGLAFPVAAQQPAARAVIGLGSRLSIVDRSGTGRCLSD